MGGKGDVAALENGRRLVDDRQREGEGVVAFEDDIHLVGVAIGEALGTRPTPFHSSDGIEQQDVGYRYEDKKGQHEDRKSTRLNSSHANISYAVFCLKKK